MTPEKKEIKEETEDKSYVYVRVYQEDKDFFTSNKELEMYLVFKHKELNKKQEDLMHLIRVELEENLNKKK